MGFFGKKKFKKEDVIDNTYKGEKLVSDDFRIRIHRLANNSPVEIAVFKASIVKDDFKNSVIFSEENNFKEEYPGMVDPLVSDILSKLENKNTSIKEQIIKVQKNIKSQETLIESQSKGIIKEGNTERNINIQDEKSRLRLLKVVLYTLENKKGEGYYESVEIDGIRTLNYTIIDGELIPNWYKSPTMDNEPVNIAPDMSLRKRYYKETTEEAINDFNDSQDLKWKGILKFLTILIIAILLLTNMGWAIYNARTSADLRDESLQPELDRLNVEITKAKQSCAEEVRRQVETNGILIDWAKIGIMEEIERAEQILEDNDDLGNDVSI